MPLRFALGLLLCASFANSAPTKNSAKANPAASKPAAKSSTTWSSLVAYALKNGVDRPFKAPLSRNLGFDSDLVPTKAMRVKAESSHDKFDHSIYVSFGVNSEGKAIPRSIILSKTKKVLNALRTNGLRGSVQQTVIDPLEKSVKSDSEYEMSYFLKSISLEKLSTK